MVSIRVLRLRVDKLNLYILSLYKKIVGFKFTPGSLLFLIFATEYFIFRWYEFAPVHDTAAFIGFPHYFYTALENGYLPLWNMFSQGGTPFWQNYQMYGMLDPVFIIPLVFRKIFHISTFDVYLLHYFFTYFIFIYGTYILINVFAKNRYISFWGSLLLKVSIFLFIMRQNGTLDPFYLLPLMMFFLIKVAQGDTKLIVPFFYCLAITSNTYIPSPTFYILCTIIPLIYSKQIIALIRDKNFYIGIFVFLLMISPVIVLALKMETFMPIVRILQQGAYKFPKMFASDISNARLFSSYGMTADYAHSLTTGNLWGVLFEPIRYWTLSEVYIFIGVLPIFILALHKWKKEVVYFMLSAVLIFLLADNFYYDIAGPKSTIQKIIIHVFYILRPYETLQNLGAVIVCMLVISFSLVLDGATNKIKLIIIGIISTGVLFSKMVFIKEYYWQRYWLYSYDYFLPVLLCAMAVMVIMLVYHRKIPINYIKYMIIVICFLEVFNSSYVHYYKWYPFLGVRSEMAYSFANDEIANANLVKNGYSSFRSSNNYVNSSLTRSFVGYEIFLNKKTLYPSTFVQKFILYKVPETDCFYVTRSYYDFLANVAPKKQLIVGGVVAPIVRFFEEKDVVKLQNKYEVVDAINRMTEQEVRKKLFIESTHVMSGTNYDIDDYNNIEKVTLDKSTRQYLDHPVPKDDPVSPLYDFINIEQRLNSFAIKVDNKVPGFLYVSDGYDKDWHSYVNGDKVDVIKANVAFKAIHLNKGINNVEFVYRPYLFIFSVIMWFLGNGLTGIFIVLHYMRKRL